ncbi:MAG TPA: DUF3306 domain-containing protein [Usitatibacter sp.]|nr:DUF3306 domain-containing protein [Usitatibacter sp.]
MSDENFLSRWSRRKSKARQAPGKAAADEVASSEAATSVPAARTDVAPPAAEPIPLPPVESLTSESDFAPFMQPKVDADLKRLALKKLFADPRFNVMDGLDVYIDDYTRSVPIPEDWLEKMEQMRHLGAFAKEEEAEPAAQGEAPAETPPALEEKDLPDQSVAPAPSDTSSKEISD